MGIVEREDDDVTMEKLDKAIGELFENKVTRKSENMQNREHNGISDVQRHKAIRSVQNSSSNFSDIANDDELERQATSVMIPD